MTKKQLVTKVFDFVGPAVIPTSAGDGPWIKAITGAAPPTASQGNNGELVLALTNTNEAQNVGVYMNDVLPWKLADLVRVTFWARVSVALTGTAKFRVGLASARNADPDLIATSLFYGCSGDNKIKAESDDGTTEVAATDTGETLKTALKRLQFDFSEGIVTVGPPSLSKAGTANVIFKCDNAAGLLRQVCPSKRFDVSADTGGVQLLMQIQKGAGTDVGTLCVPRIEVNYLIGA